MAHPYIRSLALSASLVAALHLGTTLSAAGQDAPRVPLGINTGRITLAGTSNMHDYTASTTSVRLVRVALAPDAATSAEAVIKPGALESFEIAIPVATLTSSKDGLAKNMHKALKAKDHPEITFRLLRLEPGAAAADALRATGTLVVAGVEREVAFDVTTRATASTLSVQGQVPLVMTDFGIAPPRAMLGMLRTDPNITVRFELVLALPLT